MQRVRVRVRTLRGGPGGRIWLQWQGPGGEPFTRDRGLDRTLRNNDWYQTCTIEAGDHPDWRQEKKTLRLEFLLEGDGLEIDSIVFEEGLSGDEQAMLRVAGGLDGAQLSINDQTRVAMQTPPGQTCSIPVALPAADPTGDDGPLLRFATGISWQGWSHGGNAVRFRIHAQGHRSPFKRLIFEQRLDPVETVYDRIWHDHEVSLARYAGQRVRLIFTTEDMGGGDSTGSSAFAVWGHPLIHNPAPPPTNVLVILVDTLRADHLGSNGYPGRATVHLDRWAGRGVSFQQAVSSSCWTAPAVASLFTGQHPFSHGVRSRYTLGLGEEAETLAEQFRGGGYFTGAISDNLLIIPDNGYAQGFHTFLTIPWDRPEREARELTDLAITWLENNGDRPYFFYLHYMDPHGPYTPEDPFDPGPPRMPGEIRDCVEAGDCGLVTKRTRGDGGSRLAAIEQRRLLDLYDGEIAATDFHIARLLAWMERAGVLERTAVVLLADHGEGFGEHDFYSHAHTLHDEELLVPLVILPPPGRNLARGVRHPGIVRMVDLAPTILDLAGLDPGGERAGQSLVRFMGSGEPLTEEVDAYSEHSAFARPDEPLVVESAVRSPGLKLIFSPGRGEYQLFDLAADPLEQADIFAAGHRMAGTMMDRLDRYLAEAAAVPVVAPPTNDGLEAEQLQQLEALGYLDQ